MSRPLFVITVAAPTVAELRRRRDAASQAGADLVELRLDSVSDPDVPAALAGRTSPVIVTCRPEWEGGAFKDSEAERRRILDCALQLGADGEPSPLEVGRQRVHDVRALPLAGQHASLAEHLEVMADRRLADGAALHEVARAHAVRAGRNLPNDRQTDGIGQRLEEANVRIGADGHGGQYIDTSRY